jgi:hypothetical protein
VMSNNRDEQNDYRSSALVRIIRRDVQELIPPLLLHCSRVSGADFSDARCMFASVPFTAVLSGNPLFRPFETRLQETLGFANISRSRVAPTNWTR